MKVDLSDDVTALEALGAGGRGVAETRARDRCDETTYRKTDELLLIRFEEKGKHAR